MYDSGVALSHLKLKSSKIISPSISVSLLRGRSYVTNDSLHGYLKIETIEPSQKSLRKN